MHSFLFFEREIGGCSKLLGVNVCYAVWCTSVVTLELLVLVLGTNVDIPSSSKVKSPSGRQSELIHSLRLTSQQISQ